MLHVCGEAWFVHPAMSPAEGIMKVKTAAPKAKKPHARNLAPKDGQSVKGGYLTYKLKNVVITSYS